MSDFLQWLAVICGVLAIWSYLTSRYTLAGLFITLLAFVFAVIVSLVIYDVGRINVETLKKIERVLQ